MPFLCHSCGKREQDPFQVIDELWDLDLVHRSRENTALSPEGSIALQTLLSSGRIETTLERFDAEVARLQNLVETLKKERAVLQTQAETAASLLAPIRRLPVELLSHVFDMYHHGIDKVAPRAKLHHVGSGPFHLGWISSHWRSVAIGNMSLWTTILLRSTSPSTIVDPETEEAALQAVLSRSQSAPLNVTIIIIPTDPAPSTLLVDLVFAHSHRWKKVDLCTSYETMLSLLPHSRIGQFSLLESIQLLSLLPTPSNAEPIMCLDNAPMLKSLKLGSMPQVFVPFEQITNLQMYATMQEFQQLLPSYPNLTHAELTVADQWPTPGELTLINLQALTLLGKPRILHTFMDTLILPSLSTLALSPLRNSNRIHTKHKWLSAERVIALLERSNVELHGLAISAPMCIEEILLLLNDQRVKHLRSLTIHESHRSAHGHIEMVSDRLMANLHSLVLELRDLRDLWVKSEGRSQLTKSVFLSMVRSRIKEGGLEVVKVETVDQEEFARDVEEELKMIRPKLREVSVRNTPVH